VRTVEELQAALGPVLALHRGGGRSERVVVVMCRPGGRRSAPVPRRLGRRFTWHGFGSRSTATKRRWAARRPAGTTPPS